VKKFINKVITNQKMKPSVHLLVSLILAVILYPTFNWKVLFILIGGVLIDIDHYFLYIYRFRKFNLRNCYNYFYVEARKDNFKGIIGSLLIFHTIELLLISIILSFYIEFALIFTISLLIHYLLDLIWHYLVPKRLIANHSIISWIIKNKIQKQRKK
jgi:hypothetical protein